jgi:hypothetical protein
VADRLQEARVSSSAKALRIAINNTEVIMIEALIGKETPVFQPMGAWGLLQLHHAPLAPTRPDVGLIYPYKSIDCQYHSHHDQKLLLVKNTRLPLLDPAKTS